MCASSSSRIHDLQKVNTKLKKLKETQKTEANEESKRAPDTRHQREHIHLGNLTNNKRAKIRHKKVQGHNRVPQVLLSRNRRPKASGPTLPRTQPLTLRLKLARQINHPRNIALIHTRIIIDRPRTMRPR
jgi:hypothetical protein